MKPYILGSIFARGGSKGIPRKNIKPLAGKPLIAYSIEVGRAVGLIDRLIVSTDDKEIAAIARQHGAEVPFMRPADLATDSSAEILSWKHAVNTIEEQSGKAVDILVCLPATSPLKEPGDVRACIEKLLNTDADIVITVREAERNPYFNMVVLDKEDNAHVAVSGKTLPAQRQQAPKVYDVTTVAYAARRSYVLGASSVLEGKVKAVVIPSERAIDVDTMLDFEIAEFLMKRRSEKK